MPRREQLLDRLLEVEPAVRFAPLLADAPGGDQAIPGYDLTRELGRGGMATVHLARDLKHGRDVAIKIMRPFVAAMLGPERFLREIEIVARLRHPHIVPLFDSGNANGALYFVMPYETGASLRQLLEREGALPAQTAVRLVREVCDALDYAHERGVVHRDIKPDNVLLSGGHALVADFGIATAVLEIRENDDSKAGTAFTARSQSILQMSGAGLGTPTYMAPEQIAGDAPIDHRADIYAVGVLAYELLMGRPPFSGATRHEVLNAHLRELPPPLDREVPDKLAEVVMQCLAKNPARRCPDARELLRRLDALSVKPRTTQASNWRDRWSRTLVERLTDFPGSEVDAAISRDGRFTAFLSDRDGVFDAFVSEIGGTAFRNLTQGRLPNLYNEDVRNIGFTHDAADVWVRVASLEGSASVCLIERDGGALRPFVKSAVTVAWSPDGARLAYHDLAPGDPVFVADADGRHPRQLYVGPPGVHSHHLSWSPDGRFVYCSHGTPPNEMDVWRIPVDEGRPEQLTQHGGRVAYPVALDQRTVIYTATDADGRGPWLYVVDTIAREPLRLSVGVEHFISISAADALPNAPRRLIASVSNPTVELWQAPITSGTVDDRLAERLALPTAHAAAPRFASRATTGGKGTTLLYLASRGSSEAIWHRSSDGTTELWRPNDGAIVGAPAASPDGSTICVPVRRGGRVSLWRVEAYTGHARPFAESLDVRSAASWSPDGKWIAVAATSDVAIHVFKIPADGGTPTRLTRGVATNPVWAPDGEFILYSGTPRGRGAPLEAMTPDGSPYTLPGEPLIVDRRGDSYRFVPGSRNLVVKLGSFRHQDFWLLDLVTAARRQLTRLHGGESISRFDVSPDGTKLVFERVRENSHVVLLEVPMS